MECEVNAATASWLQDIYETRDRGTRDIPAYLVANARTQKLLVQYLEIFDTPESVARHPRGAFRCPRTRRYASPSEILEAYTLLDALRRIDHIREPPTKGSK